jgi:hypothetical protein
MHLAAATALKHFSLFKLRPLALLLGVACMSGPACAAQDNGSWPALRAKLNEFGLDGSVRVSHWSSNKLLDDDNGINNAMLWARFNRSITDNVSLFASGHVGVEDVGSDNRDRNRLREGYVDLRLNQWDVRVGKQIIAWGRADRINPTDNLTPRDFTLLVPEEDDNRFGSLAVNAKLMLRDNQYALHTIWLPDFQPYRYPIPVPAGFSVDKDTPDGADNFAVKLERSGGKVDWSVSYFYGYDLVPDWRFMTSALPSLVAQGRHHKIHVLGLDGATTSGNFGIRWELAYTHTKDSDGDDPEIKNPFFYGVFGVERTFMDNLNVNVQVYTRHVRKFTDPGSLLNPLVQGVAWQSAISSNQAKQNEYGVTTRISKKWMNDTLEGEFAAIYNFSPNGYLLRPKIIYAFTDHFKGCFGAEYYGGSDKSFFGNIDKNKAVYAELSYWF